MSNHDLFKLNGIHTVEEFINEFFEIVELKDDRDLIKSKVVTLLQQLVSTSIDTLCRSKNFEKVTGAKNIYAMKIHTKTNLRILFSYCKGGGILLHSFMEKAGKRKTDYSGNLPIAIRRLKEYEYGGNISVKGCRK